MALSTQNKNFLSLLHKLGIDLSASDKTFDGLFENVPESANYFFEWFLENITEDNVLTDSEEALYFEIAKKNEDEINTLLPLPVPYEELQSLDFKYINNVLPNELKNLENSYKEINDINCNFESYYVEAKEKNIVLSENVNIWKKKLNSATIDCNNTVSLLVNKFEEIKNLLLSEPYIHLDVNSYNILYLSERGIFSHLQNKCILNNNILSSSNFLSLMPELKENLAFVKNFFILSQGSLMEKKIRRKFLSSLLQNNKKSVMSKLNLATAKNTSNKVTTEHIQVLEKEIQKKACTLSKLKILKIESQFFLMKTELYQNSVRKLMTCKNYLELNKTMNLWLQHILLKFLNSIKNVKETRNELQTKLSETERNCSVNVANFKLKKIRFCGASFKVNQHSLLSAVQSILHSNTDSVASEVLLKKLSNVLSHNSNLTSLNVRNMLKSMVISILNNKLCGPTMQLQFLPTNLFIKYQSCVCEKNELSHEIKRLVNRYVEAKEVILKSDRKQLLSWIEFVADRQFFPIKEENLDKCVNRSQLFMSTFDEI